MRLPCSAWRRSAASSAPSKTPLGRDTVTGPDQLLPVPSPAAGLRVPSPAAPALSWPLGAGAIAEIQNPRYAPTGCDVNTIIDSRAGPVGISRSCALAPAPG